MWDHVGIPQLVLLAAHGFSVFPFVCPVAILEATELTSPVRKINPPPKVCILNIPAFL